MIRLEKVTRGNTEIATPPDFSLPPLFFTHTKNSLRKHSRHRQEDKAGTEESNMRGKSLKRIDVLISAVEISARPATTDE